MLTPLPFNIVTGADNNNDTTVNDRHAGTFDLRLSRMLKLAADDRLELMIEEFNLLNRANVVNVGNTIGNARPGARWSF